MNHRCVPPLRDDLLGIPQGGCRLGRVQQDIELVRVGEATPSSAQSTGGCHTRWLRMWAVYV